MARIICIANQKGGVGKTTTAVNLAASLGLAGEATLLIDLDPQGSATSGFGIEAGEGGSTYEVLLGGRSIEDVAVATEIEAVRLVPATRDLIGAEIELVPQLAREFRLSKALSTARNGYKFILIDCPPSLGLLTINGLAAADTLLIPLQCEYYALEGLSSLLDTVKAIQEGINPKLRIEGVLLTMFDTRNSLSHQVSEEVRRHFPSEVFRAVIPRNVRISESPSHGKPVVLYDPQSRGALSYVELAEEVREVEES